VNLQEVKESLSDAIINDAIEAQGPFKHANLSWGPREDTFRYALYRGDEYAAMDATNPQITAYYVNGWIKVTHNGYERHLVNQRMKGIGNWTFKRST